MRIWAHLAFDSTPREGRWFLHFGRNCFSLEWSFGKPKCHFTIWHDLDNDLVIGLALPYLFSIYIGLDRFFPKWARGDWLYSHTLTGIRVFGDKIWLSLFCDDDQWPPRWGWKATLSPIDWLLGEEAYSKELIRTTPDVQVKLPEGIYLGEVKMYRATWKRPRWKAKAITRAEIEVEGGIPVPGKGENSWDMGDDAIYSIMAQADNEQEIAETLRDSVLRSRTRYGNGINWKPDDPEAWATPAFPNLSGQLYPGAG